jgi:uncharacterized OB-fold protein
LEEAGEVIMSGDNKINNRSRSNKRQIPIREGLFYQPSSSNEQPYLIGNKCKLCGYVSFPQRAVCPMCLKQGTMEETAIGRRGKINSFTVSRVAAPGFAAPYIQAYVDLAEGPRIFSLITGCEPSEQAVEIGTAVELVIEKICEDEHGNDLMGYKFRPIKS